MKRYIQILWLSSRNSVSMVIALACVAIYTIIALLNLVGIVDKEQATFVLGLSYAGVFRHLTRNPVVLNWYPKIQAEQSVGVRRSADLAVPQEGKLEQTHLAFLDYDALYFEVEKFKNERSWYNLNLPREVLPDLLADRNWYRLYIPKEELDFTSFDRVRRWQEIAAALLRKYCERYYFYRKQVPD